MLVNLLQVGKKDIENAIRWQGLELEVEICVKQLAKDKVQEDMQKLQNIFEEVSVKEVKQKLIWKK